MALSEPEIGGVYDTKYYSSRPPVAKRVSTEYQVGSAVLTDNYLWLRNLQNDSDVTALIRQENQFKDTWFESKFASKTKLSVTKELDEYKKIMISSKCLSFGDTVSKFWLSQQHVYWISSNAGGADIYNRRKTNMTESCSCLDLSQPEEILLDVGAALHDAGLVDFGTFGIFEPNPFDDSLFAYSIDPTGSEHFSLYIRDIVRGTTIRISPDFYYTCRWWHDPITEYSWIYYNTVDPLSGTPLHISRYGPYGIGAAQARSEPVFSERNTTFVVDLVQTNDLKYLFIKIYGQTSSEYRIVNGVELEIMIARVQGVYYDIEHNSGYFYIRSNAGDSLNFQITRSLISSVGSRATVVVPHHAEIFLEYMEMLYDSIVVWSRKDGLRVFQAYRISDFGIQSGSGHQAPSRVYSISPAMSDFESRIFRKFSTHCFLFANSSFIQPPSVYSADLLTGLHHLLLTESDNLSYNAHEFTELNLMIPAKEGYPQIPISLVYRNDKRGNSLALPTIVTSYGAYGGFQDPTFAPDIFSFLDRGFVWAVCHPRGDADMGTKWYLDGKFEKKINTILDSRACVEGLVNMGIADANFIALKGRSAGGLIAGNAMTWKDKRGRPILKAVVAHVPFIDPIFDMIDYSVPWTPFEWDEWGNPKDKVILDSMRKYSPYHLIAPQKIPFTYVSCGMLDSRVPYWEPMKFVSKWRFTNPDSSNIINRINQKGHFISDTEETAEWIAFVITALAIS